MQVQAYDPYQSSLPEGVRRCESLVGLLESSDVLSIHVSLTEETRGMVSVEELDCLPRGAILVNTSRGAVLDEAALLSALESGRLAGAGLDVLQDEHRIGEGQHPLIEYARTHENLLITPHIGGATQESVEKADLFLVKKVREFLIEKDQQGRKP
jgi:D-3-phosphoglycerate dehydrogenase